MSISFKQLIVYLSLLAIGGGAGSLASQYLKADGEVNQTSTTVPVVLQSPAVEKPAATVAGLPLIPNHSNFIAEVAEKVGPAVVRIDAARTVASAGGRGSTNPLFREFFGDDLPVPDERVERGTGSGFILSSDGRILTNAHVVAGSDSVQVTLKDGRVLDGKVIGVDPLTDVAVVKIPATGLPTAVLGRSENLVPGQWAIAIGNPLGLDNTVTVGIISAIGRSSAQVGIPDRRVRFLQTDAAINPGNSGGPLLNDQGEVIGVNTAIRADAQGLGFAIPIETAQRVADQLTAKGSADHPFVGIQMVDLTPALKAQITQKTNLKITVDQGVVIMGVLSDSPAAKAGLEQGDIIQKINGVPIETAADVQEQVEASAVGEMLQMEISRNGQSQVVQVRPAAFPVDQLNLEG